jgi:hypothetical protein
VDPTVPITPPTNFLILSSLHSPLLSVAAYPTLTPLKSSSLSHSLATTLGRLQHPSRSVASERLLSHTLTHGMLGLVSRSVADSSFVEFIVCSDGLVMLSLHLLDRVVKFFLKPKI